MNYFIVYLVIYFAQIREQCVRNPVIVQLQIWIVQLPVMKSNNSMFNGLDLCRNKPQILISSPRTKNAIISVLKSKLQLKIFVSKNDVENIRTKERRHERGQRESQKQGTVSSALFTTYCWDDKNLIKT